MKLKRIKALAIVMIMPVVLAMTACGNSNKSEDVQAESVSTTSDSMPVEMVASTSEDEEVVATVEEEPEALSAEAVTEEEAAALAENEEEAETDSADRTAEDDDTLLRGDIAETLYGVNVREEASTESAIVGTLVAGCAVNVMESDDDWTYIDYADAYQSFRGYVQTRFLKLKEETPARTSGSTGTASSTTTTTTDDDELSIELQNGWPTDSGYVETEDDPSYEEVMGYPTGI